MATGALTISLEYDASSLIKHKEWMQYLASSEAAEQYGVNFDIAGMAQRLEGKAKAVVQEHVYDEYSGNEDSYHGLGVDEGRSMNLLNSISAIKNKFRSNDATGFAVFSDLNKTGKVTPWSIKGSAESKMDDGISYAAYFLGDYKSFIKPAGMPKRDFWNPMKEIVLGIVQKQSRIALERLLRSSRPDNKA